MYCISCVITCKIGFTNWNAKVTLLRASMVVTYYIKLFRMGADRHNGILMYLLLLVAETIIFLQVYQLKLLSFSMMVKIVVDRLVDSDLGSCFKNCSNINLIFSCYYPRTGRLYCSIFSATRVFLEFIWWRVLKYIEKTNVLEEKIHLGSCSLSETYQS